MIFPLIAFMLTGDSVIEKGYLINPVPFTQVHLRDQFWAPKIEVNRKITIPYAFKKCEETGRMFNFERAAKAIRGEVVEDKTPPGFPFDDTDVYKVLEGAAYSLAVKRDPELEAYLDKLIKLISDAQEPDGYLYTPRTFAPDKPHEWSGKERWVLEQDQSHELYNLGHLYEAAGAHYQATGKKSLLNVATKSADLLLKTFGPDKKKTWPGHQIIEMALVKLGKATDNEEYIKLAKFFLDCRGGSAEYWQAHKHPADQDEAVGHAVRAVYMYSGMADIAALTGDTRYSKAIDKLWENVVSKKLYITGGIGATGHGEAFGANYELPNGTAYCETCAAIGNDYWNERLFLLHGDAKYMDVFERSLYNGLLSGVSLDGTNFFYPNPLESNGQHARSPWFGCACCPGNITRFMASVPGYFYATKGDEVFVNLFAESSSTINLTNKRQLQLSQKTNYPWDGKIELKVENEKVGKASIKVRVPGWARGEVVPSDLYTYADTQSAKPTFKLNGKLTQPKIEKGYASFDRDWKKGDVIEINLPMEVRKVRSHKLVKENTNRISFERGPIVYCAEKVDQNFEGLQYVAVDPNTDVNFVPKKDKLGGIVELEIPSTYVSADDNGNATERKVSLNAIPYFAWANRGRNEMRVWFYDKVSAVRPRPKPTIASQAKVTTSGGANPNAINDQQEPDSSSSGSVFFHWWPKKGTTEWVQLTFKEETSIRSASVYWFDDTGKGECRPPTAWKVFYLAGTEWKEIQTTSTPGVKLDGFNTVTFPAVKTSAIKIEVELQKGWSAGIQEMKVD